MQNQKIWVKPTVKVYSKNDVLGAMYKRITAISGIETDGSPEAVTRKASS